MADAVRYGAEEEKVVAGLGPHQEQASLDRDRPGQPLCCRATYNLLNHLVLSGLLGLSGLSASIHAWHTLVPLPRSR